MIIKPLKHNEYAGLDLGSISGSREELTLLRDALNNLLSTSVGDSRRHTTPIMVGNGGIMIHIGPSQG
jgi:hypothetical protein